MYVCILNNNNTVWPSPLLRLRLSPFASTTAPFQHCIKFPTSSSSCSFPPISSLIFFLIFAFSTKSTFLAFSQLLRFLPLPLNGGERWADLWVWGGRGTAYTGGVCMGVLYNICVCLELAKIAAHVTLWSRAAFRSSSAPTGSSSFSLPSSAGTTHNITLSKKGSKWNYLLRTTFYKSIHLYIDMSKIMSLFSFIETKG